MSIGEVELKRVDEEGLSTRIIEDERLVEEEENGFLPSGSTMPVRASLLTQSAKYVLLFTSFVDILGFSLPNPLMPYYFSHLEGFSKENSGAVYGLIMSSFSIGQFLGSLGAGIMSDKFGRRLPILICLLGNCLFLIYTGFAPSVAQLIMARGMAGLFAGTQSVCSAYVSDVTTEAERPRELGHLSAAITLGFIAGPAIGIAIGLSFGVEHIKMAFQVTCLAASLIAAGAFVTGLFFLKDTAQAGPPSVAAAPAVWTVVKSLLRKRNFLLVLVITFLSQFEGTCLEAALPLLLVEEQKCEIWQVLAVFATMALAVPVIVGVLYPKMSEKIGQKRVMIFGMSVHIVGMILMPIFMLWYIQVPIALLLAFMSLVDPALQLIASFSAGRSYGSAMGMLRAVGAVSRICGPFAAGALYDVKFGEFLFPGRRRLLPFWTGAAAALCACVLVPFLTNTEPSTQIHEEED